MRRTERITMWAGAVLVVGAIAGGASFLAGNGARPAPHPARDSDLVPEDVAWAVFEHCNPPDEQWTRSISAWSMSYADGSLHVEAIGTSPLPEEDRAYVDGVNQCLSRYAIRQKLYDYDARRIDGPAERLLAYDVAARWLIPCIVGHAADPGYMVGPDAYLDEEQAPWYSYYSLGDAELDDVLAARRECGVASQPYAL